MRKVYPSAFQTVEKAQNIDVIANQPAGWCGDPFSLSLVERHDPRGRLCAEGTRKAPPCRGYGLPRQCVHWLAMTWFFDTLKCGRFTLPHF